MFSPTVSQVECRVWPCTCTFSGISTRNLLNLCLPLLSVIMSGPFCPAVGRRTLNHDMMMKI